MSDFNYGSYTPESVIPVHVRDVFLAEIKKWGIPRDEAIRDLLAERPTEIAQLLPIIAKLKERFPQPKKEQPTSNTYAYLETLLSGN